MGKAGCLLAIDTQPLREQRTMESTTTFLKQCLSLVSGMPLETARVDIRASLCLVRYVLELRAALLHFPCIIFGL